jgi:hypothetical protein
VREIEWTETALEQMAALDKGIARRAYWGFKWEAKKESNRIRRENWKREIRDNTIGVMPEQAKDQPCASSASAIASRPAGDGQRDSCTVAGPLTPSRSGFR